MTDQLAGSLTPVKKTYTIAGKDITFETGKLAQFADGAVSITDTNGNYLLTTTGVDKHPNPDAAWFPLSVDYQERFYAGGKIAGGRFNKREGRPSTSAVLSSRLIDRPIRPMFPKGVVNAVQIIPTIMSANTDYDFSHWGVTGASIGLQLGGIHEFEGPVSAARIAHNTDGSFIFDPSFEQIKNAEYELLVAGTADMITMVEFQGNEVSEGAVLKGFEYAQGILKELANAQSDFIAEYQKSYEITPFTLSKKEGIEGLDDKVHSLLSEADIEPLYALGKMDFHDKLEELNAAIREKMGHEEDNEEMTGDAIDGAVYSFVKKVMRKNVIASGRRLDGRNPEDVRPINCEVSMLPLTHGSGLFRRGVTSALTVATLGGPRSTELVEGMYPEYERRYMHHYNFPPYSVGEVRMMRGVGRREVGHGNLGEKALVPVLPDEETFPYVIRLVSEIHTCNGSSSMASVCGSTLALMDAGVPIKAPVSGIAMGMIFDEDTGAYKILSDIQAQEDFLGDLDFKVAGTSKGITALQMDTKVQGLSMDIVRKVFTQAAGGRAFILEGMLKAIDTPRSEVSENAPALLSLKIDPERIGEVIGKGGETIQGLQKDYEVEISIEEDGMVTITGDSREGGEKAKAAIEGLLKEVEVGEVYEGKIVKILDGIGAIADIGNGKSGMIHISKLADKRVENVTDIVKEGEIHKVKVLQVDKAKGRIGLQKL